MIQRIQSLFLGIAALLMLLLFVIPFAKIEEMSLNATHNIALMIVTILCAIANIFTIFQYKNRSLQLKLSYLGIFLPVVFYGLAHVAASPENIISIHFDRIAIGFPIPAIAMVLAYLAKVNIGKDEKLVKSVDRLR